MINGAFWDWCNHVYPEKQEFYLNFFLPQSASWIRNKHVPQESKYFSKIVFPLIVKNPAKFRSSVQPCTFRRTMRERADGRRETLTRHDAMCPLTTPAAMQYSCRNPPRVSIKGPLLIAAQRSLSGNSPLTLRGADYLPCVTRAKKCWSRGLLTVALLQSGSGGWPHRWKLLHQLNVQALRCLRCLNHDLVTCFSSYFSFLYFYHDRSLICHSLCFLGSKK